MRTVVIWGQGEKAVRKLEGDDGVMKTVLLTSCPGAELPASRGVRVELLGHGRVGEQQRCGGAAVVAGGSGGAPCVVLVGGGS